MSAGTLEPARAAFATVARRGVGPLVLGLALALIATRASGDQPDMGPDARGLAMLWLHLPGVIVALSAVVATLEAWPLFGRERDGRPLLQRLQRTPLEGCGTAAVGGSVAAALLLGAAGATFALAAPGVSGLAPPRAWTRAATLEPTVLDARTGRVRLRADGVVSDAVRLNPLVAATRGGTLVPVELSVAIDGERLEAPCTVSGNGEQVVLPFAGPRAVHDVEITRTSDATLTVLFTAGSVELRSAQAHSLVANLTMAVACYAVPALLALLAAAALRRGLGQPALTTFALATFAIVALIELAPEGQALSACARGRWLPNEPLTWSTAVAVAAGLCGLGLLPNLRRGAREGR